MTRKDLKLIKSLVQYEMMVGEYKLEKVNGYLQSNIEYMTKKIKKQVDALCIHDIELKRIKDKLIPIVMEEKLENDRYDHCLVAIRCSQDYANKHHTMVGFDGPCPYMQNVESCLECTHHEQATEEQYLRSIHARDIDTDTPLVIKEMQEFCNTEEAKRSDKAVAKHFIRHEAALDQAQASSECFGNYSVLQPECRNCYLFKRCKKETKS